MRKDYELLCRKETKSVKNSTNRPYSVNRPSVVFDDSFQVLSFKNPLRPSVSFKNPLRPNVSFKNPLRPSVHPHRVPSNAVNRAGAIT